MVDAKEALIWLGLYQGMKCRHGMAWHGMDYGCIEAYLGIAGGDMVRYIVLERSVVLHTPP